MILLLPVSLSLQIKTAGAVVAHIGTALSVDEMTLMARLTEEQVIRCNAKDHMPKMKMQRAFAAQYMT